MHVNTMMCENQFMFFFNLYCTAHTNNLRKTDIAEEIYAMEPMLIIFTELSFAIGAKIAKINTVKFQPAKFVSLNYI